LMISKQATSTAFFNRQSQIYNLKWILS
jgi:hypothetical protein